MTALQAPVRPVVAVLPGWCVPCAAAGEQRPAADPRSGSACRDHLRLLPPRPPLPGQPALFDVERVSRLLQAEYETGVRMACSPCAAAGRDELGLPDRIEGDPTPLCLECWRRRERQAGRRGMAAAGEPVEWVDELPAGCPACESPDPSPACWLCGYSWLADARAAHEQLLAAEQAAVDAEFARVAAREQTAQRVQWLTGWVSRLQDVLGAYTGTGGRGAGWGRAVELLADVLARDAAVHAGGPGRPSAFRLVAAVMAVDADYRSGRRAMPGRAECAELAGICERAVYSAWKRGVQLGTWVRTTPGRRLSLAERMATGRGNDRAVYDLRPVTRSTDPAARDAMVPAALAALDELLGWGMQLLTDAQHALGQLDVAAQGTGRAPSAAVLAVRAEQARMRQAVARTRTAATVLASHLQTGNKCTPHTVSRGECVSSCLGVKPFTCVNRANGRRRKRPRSGRGKGDIGASRSPMKSGSGNLESRGSVVGRPDGTRPAGRPRTPYTVDSASPAKHKKPRKRPDWHVWAYPLARELRKLWTWLQGEDVHQLAATLGKRLSDRWTAAAVVDLVDQDRAGRALPVEMYSPIGLLRELLEHALTGERQPALPARRHDEHLQQLAEARRAAIAAEAQARQAAAADARAEHAERDQVAAGARTGGLALARATLAAAADRALNHPDAIVASRPTRHREPGDAERMAAVRAELAARAAAAAPGEPDGEWSEPVAQAGAGLPDGWIPARDR